MDTFNTKQTNTLNDNIIEKETSERIKSLRFILMVLVVFVHAKSATVDNIFNSSNTTPLWISFIIEFFHSLGDSSVLVFFIFSGYLQSIKQDKYLLLLKKRTKTLLIPYITWISLVILTYFICQSVPFLSVFFPEDRLIIRNWSFLDFLKAYTYYNLKTPNRSPLIGQFWFLRELIIYIIISPLIIRIIKKQPIFFLFIILIPFFNKNNLYFTSSVTALTYYILGCYFGIYNINFFKLSDKLYTWQYIILIVFLYYFKILQNLLSLTEVFFLLKLSFYFINKENLKKKLFTLSNYSFFLYAIHTPILENSINILTMKFLPHNTPFILIQYFITVFLTVFIGTFAGICLNKFFPHIYGFITGNRIQQ